MSAPASPEAVAPSAPPRLLITNMQFMRSAAAYMVLWAHAREIIPEANTIPHLPSGMSGVDIFFIISGFVMAYTTTNPKLSVLDFTIRRIVRVAPIYYVMIFVTTAIWLVKPSLFNSTVVDFESLSKTLLFIPYAKTDERIYPILFIGWTLNYEMIFYALFALSLAISRKRRLLICSAFVLAFVLAGPMVPDLRYGAPLYAYTRPIMFDFLMGLGIGALFPRIQALATRYGATPFAILCVVAALVLVYMESFSYPVPAILPDTDTAVRFGIPAAVILLGLLGLECANVSIRSRFLLLLGDSSYSFYLVHVLVVGLFVAVSRMFEMGFVMRLGLFFVAIAATTVSGIVFYKLVEQPLVRAMRKRPSFGQRPLAVVE